MTKCPLCQIRRAALREFDGFLEWLANQPEWPELANRYSSGKILQGNNNQEAAKGGKTSELHFDNKPGVLDKPPRKSLKIYSTAKKAYEAGVKERIRLLNDDL
jgi:hypothetical protein